MMNGKEISKRIREKKKAAMAAPEGSPEEEMQESPEMEAGEEIPGPEMEAMAPPPEEDEKMKRHARIRKSMAKVHR